MPGTGLCTPHFHSTSWLPVKLCPWGAPEEECEAGGGRRDELLHICVPLASFLPPSARVTSECFVTLAEAMTFAGSFPNTYGASFVTPLPPSPTKIPAPAE